MPARQEHELVTKYKDLSRQHAELVVKSSKMEEGHVELRKQAKDMSFDIHDLEAVILEMVREGKIK